MITINLLPEECRKKESQGQKLDLSKFNIGKIPLLKIAIAAVPVIVVIPIILLFMGFYARSNLGSLEKKYGNIMPAKKEADALKAQIETMRKKMNAIDELMVKRFGWAKKLNSLSDSMTPGIWLTELSYSEKLTERPATINIKGLNPKGQNDAAINRVMEKALAKYLIVSGYASGVGEDGTAAVGKFIKSLKDNSDFYSDFSEIELGVIKTDRIKDQEVMSFRITCLFKEPK